MSLRNLLPAAYTDFMGNAEEVGNDALGNKGFNSPEKSAPFDPAFENSGRQGQIRVLIIDGHEAVRRALRVRLSVPKQFEVVGVSSHPDAAVDLIFNMRTDVVLLGLQTNSDQEMANMVRAVHDMASKSVVVIVLAPYADAIERELFINAGAKRYLLKHINSDQLIREIELAVSIDPGSSTIKPKI